MTTDIATPPWTLDRYRPGDEQGILELFRTVFGKARSLEHWEWQFRRNPYGGPFAAVARRISDGAIVGSYSVMPVQLNLVGKPVLACQSVDTAVHPEFRGQRIFERTANECYEWCRSEGLQAVIGFPNASSYPGFVRNLAWRRIVFPIEYRLRLGLASAERRRIGGGPLALLGDAWLRGVGQIRRGSRPSVPGGSGTASVFSVEATAPTDYDALWNEWKPQEVLSVWKDVAYLRWRYDEHPGEHFAHFTLRESGKLRAHAVAFERDERLTLCEWTVAGRDVPLGRRFLSRVVGHAGRRGLAGVWFLGHDAGYFDEAFAGFERRRSFANVFGGRAFSQGTLEELVPHADNWTVTFGDGDFV